MYIVHLARLAYSPSATIDSYDFALVYKGQWLNDQVVYSKNGNYYLNITDHQLCVSFHI